MPMPSRATSESPESGWISPKQCGPAIAPANTKKTTSGTGRPGIRLATNDESTTMPMMMASI